MVLLYLMAAAAAGTDLRDFCPDRPGLNTPACTMDPGHADVEIAALDWTGDRGPGERTDSFVLGDTLVRFGISDSAELQVEWQGLGYERDREGGAVAHHEGSGDVRIALRKNLHNPDGSGFSVAVMPFATVPLGDRTFGDRDWTAGLVLPVSYDLPHGLQLAMTAAADAAADEQGPGHHLAWSLTGGLGVSLTDSLGATIEFQHQRDRDPGGTTDASLAALSLGWQPGPSLQLDVGGAAGLSHAAPDIELYAGIARRF